MQTHDSEQVRNGFGLPENRKRKRWAQTLDAIQKLSKALQGKDEGMDVDKSTSTVGAPDADSTVRPSAETAPSTSQKQDNDPTTSELPSLHDSHAIHEFFRRIRQRSHQEFIATQSQLGSAVPTEAVSHDPMKQIVEQSDKEMSVKEALAKGFRNYKVRLPKKKIPFELDPAIDTSVLYSLFANDVVDENQKDPPQTFINPHVSVRDALSVLTVPTDGNLALSALPSVPQASDRTVPLQAGMRNTPDTDISSSVKSEPNDLPGAGDVHMVQRANGDEVIEEKPSVYTLPPFWKLPIVVSKGYRGGYYVHGVKYVQMTTLIHNEALAVPLEVPIRLEIEGEIKTFTFNKLLLVNGIAINDPNQCGEISKIFTTSVLLILHSIAEHLLCNCGPNPLNPHAEIKLDCEPITVSAEQPPIVSHKPQYFAMASYNSLGSNEIFDPSKPSAPSPAISEPLPIFEDTKPCFQETPQSEQLLPLPQRPNIPLTARQKGLVVTHFDTGASLEELAVKFRVPIEAIEHIILNRAEVIRDQTAALMAENDMDDDRERIATGGRKRSKVRRTSFVGLNILMWRFFKDCRDNGIVLNGKLLKEHAMMISRQLGLENFKGSEGWLDAFKRRHRIDLKLMSGVPVNYEETDEDRMEDDHDDSQNSSKQFNISQVHSEGTTAALLDCVEKAVAPPKASVPPVAVVSIANTKPLDLNNLFGSNEGVPAAASVNGTPSSQASPARMHQQVFPLPPSDEKGFIAAVVKSAAVRVYDKELSSALETVRSYILSNDASAMPTFLELQMKLAAISREQSKRLREEHQNGDEPTLTT
ncbi:HTH CENPB-type domain-containing protein [Trichostrongylus colubriformis]|uniref:HTH CENPB-type domain-containing protein n=1 Tax=Trichostrongylus colubriformis TaxID=6319 RepID=A0AAN8FV15_TRICO